MAQKLAIQTTYAPERSIQPIYAGGSIALSQDGRILAACLEEDVLLTSLSTGEELARIEGDGELITTLCLTPSASHLIVCARSLSMRIFEIKQSPTNDQSIDAELIKTLKPHSSPVVTSAVDHTGTLVATGSADGTVKVWDIRGGYATHSFHGHGGVISALHFFEIETTEAENKELRKVGKKGGSKKRHNADEQQGSAEESSLGFRLASGAEDGKIRIWNLHKRNCTAILDSHVSVVRSIDFSGEENALVSGSRDKTLIVWDAMTWKPRRTIPVLESIESVGFLKQGSLVFSGGENGRLRLWSVAGGNEVTEEQEPGSETESISDVLRYPTLPYLISVHADQTLVFHSLSSISELSLSEIVPPLSILRRISGTHDEVIDLAFVGSDRSYLALATNLEDVRIISLSHSTPNGMTDEHGGEGFFGADVALLKGHEEIIICLDVDWSGHWLATGAKDNTARLWRLDPAQNSFTCHAVFTGHAESLGAISLPHQPPPVDSPAYLNPLDHPPEFLITGSQDKTIKRWNIGNKDRSDNNRALYTRKAHDKDINAIDTSPHAPLFASASQDRTVKIWSLEEGETQGVLRGHKRGVWTVKFAPKDATVPSGSSSSAGSRGLIATGSGDKSVKIWSLYDYSCLVTLEGHTNSVLKVLWLPSKPIDNRDKRGSLVASASGDGLVKVWDVSTGEPACTLDNHIDRVWSLAVPGTPLSKPNSKSHVCSLVSGGADSIITFWTDTTESTLASTTAATTARIELDQRLQNLAFSGNIAEAISLALRLDQPGRLLDMLRSVVESESGKEPDSLSGRKDVDQALGNLGDEMLWRLLRRIRDWNANARTANVAQRILFTLLRCYPASRFVSLGGNRRAAKLGASEANRGINDDGKNEEAEELRELVVAADADILKARKNDVPSRPAVRDLLDALTSYTERHYKRTMELVEESYLLEFTLGEMDEVLKESIADTNSGFDAMALDDRDKESDVVMG